MSEALIIRPAAGADRRTGLRRRLLDAAAAVIATKGPHAATFDDFVTASEVPRSVFCDQFPTVSDLLHALNSQITLEMDWGLEDARNTIDDPVVLLAAILHRIWAAVAADPVKGWVALRLEGSVEPLEPVWHEQFDLLHRRAVADGRFYLTDRRAARTLTFGAFRLATRELYLGYVGVEHAHPLIVMLLTAFGLPRDEAEAISRSQDLTVPIGCGVGGRSH